MASRIQRPAMKRRGSGIDAAFRSRQARPVSRKRLRNWNEWTLREDRLPKLPSLGNFGYGLTLP